VCTSETNYVIIIAWQRGILLNAEPTPHRKRTTTIMSTINITAADLCQLATDSGCNVQEMKAWFKITDGEKRKAIYVAKSKRVVTKVHFSGFVPEECEVIQQLSKEEAKELKLGAVRGEINTKDLRGEGEEIDDAIIEAFESNLALLRNEAEGFKLGKKKEEEVKEESKEEAAPEVTLEGLGDLNMFDDQE